MLDRRSRKVLSTYIDHIGHQEAEINNLQSILVDYRSKFGPLELENSPEVNKANFERTLQKIRKENQHISLQIKTLEQKMTDEQKQINQLSTLYQNFSKETHSDEIKNLQQNIGELDKLSQDLDIEMSQLQDELERFMSSKPNKGEL